MPEHISQSPAKTMISKKCLEIKHTEIEQVGIPLYSLQNDQPMLIEWDP